MTYAYLLLVSILAAGPYIATRNAASPAESSPGAIPVPWTRLALISSVLGILFVASLVLDAHNGAYAVVTKLGRRPLPIAMVVDGRPSQIASGVAFLLGALQSIALALLAITLRGARCDAAGRRVLVLAACVMLLIGLGAPVMRSSDVYAYVQQALSATPYHPSRALPAGTRATTIVDALWNAPLPTPYGPFWIALTRAAISPFASLGGKVVALRFVGLAGFVAICLTLRRLRVPTAILACFALDPTFISAYIVDAHNDIIALALVLVAFVTASLPLAIGLVAAAACVKLPYLIIGAVAFSTRQSLRTRIFAVVASFAIAGTAYILAAGPWLLNGLRESRNCFGPPTPFFAATHLAAGALALAAFAYGVLRNRWNAEGAWGALAFGFLPLPWYLVSCMPYALRSGRALRFLTLVPVASAILSRTYLLDGTALGDVIASAMLIAAAVFALVAWSRLRRHDRSVPSALRSAASR